MKKLLVYLKGYIKESILGPLFKLLEASFELFVPIIIKSIVDIGIGQADTGYIVKMCLLLVLLGVVGMICSITAQYFAAKASVGFVTKLRHALFKHIGNLSYTEIDTLGTSSMITRMTSDMNQVQSGVNLTLRLLLRSPFIVFGAMLMAFTVDANAAVTFVVAIPALCVVVFAIMLLSIPLYKKVQQRLDKVLNSTRENLSGARVIRAFRLEDKEIIEFDERNEQLTATQKFVGGISALMNPLTYVIINLAIIWLIHIGAIRVSTGLLTQGAVLALYNYMSQILVELIKFANLIISITKAVASGNRISAVLDVDSSLVEKESLNQNTLSEYAVEFRNVGLKYKNASDESLTNIDFSVRHGDVVGIIGGTGSGKTSLVNLIPRFYEATSGEVVLDGINVKNYPLESLRNKIGVVPQKAVLFKGSIRENMKWGNKEASDEEIMDAITIAQAGEIVAQKKEGLDFIIEQGGKNLSGGQRQRFTIARALVRKPKILILDDSASALDFATDAALRKALREMPGNPTVFIVSQRTSSIQHADKIIVLDDGQIVGIGKHEQLLESCDVYSEIYDSQFKKEAK
ncbi:MAG: ABC transporter ATP-binding protein [Clostridiaceae bacterium]|jgi:ABC-type multidrug transport system fused ATPase/permease subunit|nr:ABC transporter ATP-binding protein [Clostridiaceae bacterium]